MCQNGVTGVWSVHRPVQCRCVSERCDWCLICPQTRAMQVCVRTEGHARVSLNRERRGCCTATPVSAHLVTWAPPVKVSRGEREKARYHWFEYYRNNKHFEDKFFSSSCGTKDCVIMTMVLFLIFQYGMFERRSLRPCAITKASLSCSSHAHYLVFVHGLRLICSLLSICACFTLNMLDYSICTWFTFMFACIT